MLLISFFLLVPWVLLRIFQKDKATGVFKRLYPNFHNNIFISCLFPQGTQGSFHLLNCSFSLYTPSVFLQISEYFYETKKYWNKNHWNYPYEPPNVVQKTYSWHLWKSYYSRNSSIQSSVFWLFVSPGATKSSLLSAPSIVSMFVPAPEDFADDQPTMMTDK